MAGSVVAFGKKKKDDPTIDDQMENDPFEIDYRKYKSPHQEDSSKKVEEGEGPWLVSYADLMTLLMGFFALIASMSKPDAKAVDAAAKSAVEKFGGKYEAPYQDLEKKIKKALAEAHIENNVAVSQGPDGVSIVFSGMTLFDSGQFDIKKDGALIIDKIVKALTGKLADYKVTIEGHTDNVPMNHAILSSNWELSAVRASRVALVFEADGFDKKQLIVQGWGETRPEVPNLTAAGEPIPENQGKNRRVVIKISK